MRASRAISAGKSRISMPRKLVSGMSDATLGLAAPPVDLRLDRPAFACRRSPENLPLPQAGSNTRMRAMRLRRLSSLRALSPASSSVSRRSVQKQRVQHLQDVGDAGVVHPERAALLVVGNGLDHRPEDVRVDLRPVDSPADVEQIGARHAGEARARPALPENRPPLT